MTVLITGSSGRIGRVLRPGLEARGLKLRLFDRVPIDPDTDGPGRENVDFIAGDLLDFEALQRATHGVECVVHLAGIPEEAEFEALVESNIRGTYNVFEAARRSDVRRVVFASTNHVIGFYSSETIVDDNMPPRPDTLYGVSKVFGESLGRLYHDKHEMEVVSVRIGSFRSEPEARRELATWLSHEDAVRLFYACVTAPEVGHTVVFGASGNSRLRWRDSAASVIGYVPQDSADVYSDRELPGSAGDQFHGGVFTATDHIGGF